jgi:hypothetical protein
VAEEALDLIQVEYQIRNLFSPSKIAYAPAVHPELKAIKQNIITRSILVEAKGRRLQKADLILEND